MAGSDDNGVDITIMKYLFLARRAILEAKFLSRVTGTKTRGRADTSKMNIIHFIHCWKERSHRIIPGTE